jgi:hypothetical protein
VCLAARKSVPLADLLVRQIALAGKSYHLKPVAGKLAEEGAIDALLLVLEQLLASEQISFPLDLGAICDSLGKAKIKPLARWLASLNLLSVIEERIRSLESANRMEDAQLWKDCLPEIK